MLLCNPHNPTGTVHSRESLAALADLAAGFGATVISDEIHAPLVQPGVAVHAVPGRLARRRARRLRRREREQGLQPRRPEVRAHGHGDGRHRAGRALAARRGGVAHRAVRRHSRPSRRSREESDAWLDGLLAALDEQPPPARRAARRARSRARAIGSRMPASSRGSISPRSAGATTPP